MKTLLAVFSILPIVMAGFVQKAAIGMVES